MTKEKSPSLDRMVIKFFIQFWSLIGEEYFERIFCSISNGKFPLGMTKRLITLLFKARY